MYTSAGSSTPGSGGPSIVLDVEEASGGPSLLESGTFDFDPSLIDLDSHQPTDNTESTDVQPGLNINTQLGSKRKAIATQREFRSETLIYALIVVAGLAGLVGVVWLAIWLTSGSHTFSEAFENSEPVKHYRYNLMQYDKSARSLSLMSQAYLKAKSLTEEEVEEIRDYVNQAETYPNRQATLQLAFDQFENGDQRAAQKTLADASQLLQEKRPELEAKAREFMEGSRN